MTTEEKAPVFGEWFRGIYASEDNHTRDGMFVRKVVRTTLLNPGTWFELTDGKGKFWQYNEAGVERIEGPPNPTHREGEIAGLRRAAARCENVADSLGDLLDNSGDSIMDEVTAEMNMASGLAEEFTALADELEKS